MQFKTPVLPISTLTDTVHTVAISKGSRYIDVQLATNSEVTSVLVGFSKVVNEVCNVL